MSIQDYQKDFIELAIEHNVLNFGEFTLKSGRVSPYFFNAGCFHTGSALAQLGHYYARALMDHGAGFDMLFGPAYKGIPLATTTAVSLAQDYGQDVPVCYNRKEAKDHGEGGVLVGAPLQGKVVIIDDVITAGTAIREVISVLERSGAEASAVVIGLNRQERGQGELSAIAEVEQRFNIPVVSIVMLDDVIHYLKQTPEFSVHLDAMLTYRASYGI